MLSETKPLWALRRQHRRRRHFEPDGSLIKLLFVFKFVCVRIVIVCIREGLGSDKKQEAMSGFTYFA